MDTKNLTTFQLLVHYLHVHAHCAVAGLGEFHLRENPSFPDSNQQVFKPFQLVPIWKGLVQKTDVNFLNFCAGIWSTSASEAGSRIDFEVKQAYVYLGLHKFLKMEGLGTFSLNLNSELEFSPDLKEWVSPWSFGLKEIRFQPATEQTRKLVVDRTQTPSDLEEPNRVRERALIELREMLDKAQEAQKSQTGKSKLQLFPIIATVLTLLLVANVVYFLKKNPIQNSTKSSEPPAQTSSANLDPVSNLVESEKSNLNSEPNYSNSLGTKSQSISTFPNPGQAIRKPLDFVFDSSSYGQAIDPNILASIDISEELNPKAKEIESEIEEEPESLPEPKPELKPIAKKSNPESTRSQAISGLTPPAKPIIENKPAEPVKKGAYGLVAGAFKQRENALKLQAELKKSGYPHAEIVNPSSHKFILVLFKRFDSRQDAEKFQAGKVGDIANAWIYEGK